MKSYWLLNPSGQRASGEFVDDTLYARASELGLLERYDLAGNFPRQRVEVLRSAAPDAEVNDPDLPEAGLRYQQQQQAQTRGSGALGVQSPQRLKGL